MSRTYSDLCLVVIWIRLLLLFLHILTPWAEPLIIMIGSCLILYLGGNHKNEINKNKFLYTLISLYADFLISKICIYCPFIEPIHQIIIIFFLSANLLYARFTFWSLSLEHNELCCYGCVPALCSYLSKLLNSAELMTWNLDFVHKYVQISTWNHC
jgi:hypothetical protein